MTPRRQRLIFISFSVVLVCTAALLMMQAFRDNVVFFRTPSELMSDADLQNKRLRIGGLVESGSVVHEGQTHRFTLTDGTTPIVVEFSGLLPALFREGQGIVAEGKLGADKRFTADTILAKHDENYMPREVVDALKASGHWHELPPAARGTKP